MELYAREQERIRRYLLGQMSSEDLPELEERFFIDGELYEELAIVEDELIDEYLRGELPASDRESFSSHFMLAPEHQEKLRFALALKKYVSTEVAAQPQLDTVSDEPSDAALKVAEPPPNRPFFSFLPFRYPSVSYALAAAMLLILVGISWVTWRNFHNPTRDPAKVLGVALTPGLSRSEGEIKRINIPSDTGTVRLQLLLPENQYPFYEVGLLDSESRPLTTKNNLKSEQVNGQSAVLIDMSAALLPPGDYRIKLNGVAPSGASESVASYSFRVVP